MKTYSFDTRKYKFKEIFQELYGIKDIENLHKYCPGLNMKGMKNDSSSILHKIFYANFKGLMEEEYKRFIVEEVKEKIGENVYIQKVPCVRFSIPGSRWLTRYHKDSDYNHPNEEINVNLAITKAHNTSSLHIEKSPGTGEYIKLEQEYGEFTFIDHINCMHGSEINVEGNTMISLDFRMIKESDSEKAFGEKNGSINLGIKFNKGNYFSEVCI